MKKYLALVLALLLLFPPMAAQGDEPASPSGLPTPKPTVVSGILRNAQEPLCRSAALMEGETGEILYEFYGGEQRFPASITKVMTALLTLEAVDRGELELDEMITASETFDYDLSIYGSTQNIKKGEILSVRELLYCLLVPSANEAGNILAEAVAGSGPAFVERMNQRAAELGMADTHYVNAHGLHDPNHYTTALDTAALVREALRNDTFAEIVSTRSHTVPETNLSDPRSFSNTNALLTGNHYPGYTYSKAIGVKTGSTTPAGQCLASAARDGKRTLICVVMGAENVKNEDGSVTRNAFVESKRLLEWGFDSFSPRTLIDPKRPVRELPVTLSADVSAVALKPQEELTATLPNDLDPADFTREITTYYTSVQAPVQAGQILGEMTVRNGDTVYGTVKLVAAASAERSELLHKVEETRKFFDQTWVKAALIALGAVILLLVLRFGVFKPRKGYEHRRRRR